MSSDRARTAYIHVGPHKTGSSSIKHFLRDNREELARRGLFFPLLIGPNGKPARNHEDLAKIPEIRRDGDLKPRAKLWPEIEQVAAKGEADILLQSEMFTNALGDAEMFDRILKFFDKRGYRIVILAYVRDQPGWLNSWYVQSQKRLAGLQSFEEFAKDADERGRVEPWRYLKKFMDEPRCALEVISFERAIAAGLERDFIRRCGVAAADSLAVNELRNPNAGAKSVFAAQEIMRRAGPGLKTIQGYGPVYNRFKKRCADLGWDRTPYVALDAARYEAVRSRYAESNESFARARFGMSWDELCPPRPFRTSLFDPARASRDEMGEIEKLVGGVVAKLEELRAGQGDRRREAALAD